MQPRWLCFKALFLTVFTLHLQAPVISAQNDDPDTKAYNSYVLSMPKYKKYLASMVSIAKASERSPTAAQAFEDLGDLSIDQAVVRLNKSPEIRSAISGAGFTTREFVVLQGALLSAGLAHSLTKQGGLSPDSVVALTQVSRANLDFYGKNEAEIQRLNKEAEAKAPALKNAADDEDGDDGSE
jgi:hypothetical protein